MGRAYRHKHYDKLKLINVMSKNEMAKKKEIFIFTGRIVSLTNVGLLS